MIKQVSSGGNRNFAYVIHLSGKKEAAVIDPAPDPEKAYDYIKSESLSLKYLINTHLHYDHSGGNDFFKRQLGLNTFETVNTSKGDLAEDGKILLLDGLEIEIIATPGHTQDSICILADGDLVTGDTLFVGKVGGTYSRDDARQQFESLKKLIKLPEYIKVWPGHDVGKMPSSTIAYELENNPFIKRLTDFDDFLWLKKNWASYKKEHGID